MGRVVKAAAARLIARVCRVAAAWEQFWFTPADPIVLGVMRILAGGMLLYTHIVWGLDLPAFFGDQGWMSRDLMDVFHRGELVFSFWWHVPEAWHSTAHIVCLGVISLFWLGLFTRVTSVLSLIISISYSYRAQFANYGLDQINTILTLYLAIGPSGAALSLDRLIQRYCLARRALLAGTLPNFERVPSVSAGLATRLVQVHFCVIYFYAATAKLQGAAWWSGHAMWQAFANSEYQSTDMTWLAWYPWIGNWMTHITILWELSFSATVWNRTLRPIVLLMGVVMHFGIGAFLGMWTFGLIMTFGYLAFVPPEVMQRVLSCFHRCQMVEQPVHVSDSRSVRRAARRLAVDAANRVRVHFGTIVEAGETSPLIIDEQFISALDDAEQETDVPQLLDDEPAADESLTEVREQPQSKSTPLNGHKRNGHSPAVASPTPIALPVAPRFTLDQSPSNVVNAKSLMKKSWSTIPSCSKPDEFGHVENVPHVSQQAAKPVVPVAKLIAMRPPSRRCVLCLERDPEIQLRLFRYFTSRGFRCLLAVEPADALEQARNSYPDALLVMGTQLNDGEIESFHAQCKEAELTAPIVYVLRADQRQRIGDWLEADHTMVLDMAPSLGETRRLIEQMLAQKKKAQFVTSDA